MKKLYHSITIISDCSDDNAKGRMVSRLASLLPGTHITFIGVQNEIEAAVCLVDTLDAYENRPGIVLVNIAPRSGEAKKWPNGTPFGEFSVGKIQIFSTLSNYTLGFLQQFLKSKIKIKVYDIAQLASRLQVTTEVAKRITDSQFRSFDFLTRLVHARVQGKKFPSTIHSVEAQLLWTIGYIDRFENIKTTKIAREQYENGITLGKLKIGNALFGDIQFYSRLKDVPDGALAIVVGSSGLGELRLFEIVVQGGKASKKLGSPAIGTAIEII